MSDCDPYREKLSAFIDGELDAEQVVATEAHLEACPACRAEREELERARGALGELFAGLGAAAPPPSLEVLRPRPPARPSWLRTASALAAAAAVVLVLGLVFLQPSRPLAAKELVQVAAAQVLELRDAEFFITFGPGEAVTGGKGLGAGEFHLRLVAMAPDRYLLHRVPDTRSREIGQEGAVGFDGRESWRYDPGKGEVRIGGPVELDLENGGVKMRQKIEPGAPLLRMLAWDLFESLAKDPESKILEITGPFERRIGRRVFRIGIEFDDGKAGRWFGGQVEVMIDPQRRLIEKMSYDLRLLGLLSLYRVQLELGEVDQGLLPIDFSYRSFAPAGARIVRVADGG